MARKSVVTGNGTDGSEINLGGPVGQAAPEPDNAASGTAPEQFTDPASIGENGSGDGGQPARRGRGRPKGSGTKQKTETGRTLGADGVSGILLSVHSMLAIIAKSPELELSEVEADKIAKATIAVAKLYNVETTEKAAAWANLIGCVGAAYIPRAISINLRRKTEAAERRGQAPNVTSFPGAPPIQPRMN